MIDIDLITTLLKAIKPGARLILLGDPNQLPPIESGAFFADLVETLKKRKEVSELTVCLRAEVAEIASFSHLIASGNVDIFSHPGITFKEWEGDKSYFSLLQKVDQEEPIKAFRAFNRFRILSPLREGPLGVDALNQEIYKYFVSLHDKNTPFIAPIIILKNDSPLNLFNGEIGLLVKQNLENSALVKGDYALFQSGDEMRKIPAILLPSFEYAYSMSIHKSQGSEFDHVLLLLPEGTEKFGKKVLYTAVTRAKKSLEIWGKKETLLNTLKNPLDRLSSIQERLLF